MNKTDIERKRQILEALKERKHQRELQVALLGVSADPSIVIEQQRLAEQIKHLESELTQLQQKEVTSTITPTRQIRSMGVLSTHSCKEFTGFYDFRYGCEMLLYQIYKIANTGEEAFERFKYVLEIEDSALRRHISFSFLIAGIFTLITSIIFTNSFLQ